jgi:light-independent protochlorophyllide reductase subunit B
MMGLEEHLLGMFRDDFEFHDAAGASHLGTSQAAPMPVVATRATTPAVWHADAEREVGKIPFFVRAKARRNVERFASEHGVAVITVDTVYEAKAHFGR